MRHSYKLSDYWRGSNWTKGYINQYTIKDDFKRYFHGVSVQRLGTRLRQIPSKINSFIQKQINEAPHSDQQVLIEAIPFYLNWITDHRDELIQTLEARAIKEIVDAPVFYRNISNIPAAVK